MYKLFLYRIFWLYSIYILNVLFNWFWRKKVETYKIQFENNFCIISNLCFVESFQENNAKAKRSTKQSNLITGIQFEVFYFISNIFRLKQTISKFKCSAQTLGRSRNPLNSNCQLRWDRLKNAIYFYSYLQSVISC